MACNNTDPSALRDQGATLQRLFIHLYRSVYKYPKAHRLKVSAMVEYRSIQFHSTKSHSHVDNWQLP